MQIVKSLHSGVLHKAFSHRSKHYFAVTTLWGFRLSAGAPVLEQDLWSSIGDVFDKNALFDAGMPKTRAEFLVHGSFHAPTGEPVAAVVILASVRSGAISETASSKGAPRPMAWAW